MTKIASRLAVLSGGSIIIEIAASKTAIVSTVSAEIIISTEIVISAETVSAERITLGLLRCIGRMASTQRKGYHVGHHFGYILSCAILCIVRTGRNTAFYEDPDSFSQLIASGFSQRAPGNHINPVCQLPLFALGSHVVTIDCHGE